MSQEHWKLAEAEIVNCDVSWLASDYGNAYEGFPGHTTYTAEYVYEVAGKIHRQRMRAYSKDCVGTKFEILYDPKNPARNSAPEQLLNPRDTRSWLKHILIWGCGILFAIALKHFWPDLQ